jgi:sRNA-binding protein
MSKASKRAKVREIIQLLCARFPEVFSASKQRRPLKIGIHADVVPALGGEVRERELKSALRAYTSSASYLRSVVGGASRFGIDGHPAGTVTAEEQAHAKAKRTELVKHAYPAKMQAGDQTAEARKAPVAPAAKKLSLADLREAGRRRAAAKTAALRR